MDLDGHIKLSFHYPIFYLKVFSFFPKFYQNLHKSNEDLIYYIDYQLLNQNFNLEFYNY